MSVVAVSHDGAAHFPHILKGTTEILHHVWCYLPFGTQEEISAEALGVLFAD